MLTIKNWIARETCKYMLSRLIHQKTSTLNRDREDIAQEKEEEISYVSAKTQ